MQAEKSKINTMVVAPLWVTKLLFIVWWKYTLVYIFILVDSWKPNHDISWVNFPPSIYQNRGVGVDQTVSISNQLRQSGVNRFMQEQVHAVLFHSSWLLYVSEKLQEEQL